MKRKNVKTFITVWQLILLYTFKTSKTYRCIECKFALKLYSPVVSFGMVGY